MTDIRLTFTSKAWDRVQTQIVWVRSPVSVIHEIPDGWCGNHYDCDRLQVVTSDSQKVMCDDTPENRKALGMVEAGSPPSILVKDDEASR